MPPWDSRYHIVVEVIASDISDIPIDRAVMEAFFEARLHPVALAVSPAGRLRVYLI